MSCEGIGNLHPLSESELEDHLRHHQMKLIRELEGVGGVPNSEDLVQITKLEDELFERKGLTIQRVGFDQLFSIIDERAKQTRGGTNV